MSLPVSFASNTLERMVDFLNESNRIESIEEIDYRDTTHQIPTRGHFGALINSQQAALNHEPLTVKKIEFWQSLLTQEQVPFGHSIAENEIGHIRSPLLHKNVTVGTHIAPHYSEVPAQLEQLIKKINTELQDQDKLKDDATYCQLLGNAFQAFEAIHPFVDGNGRVGRLIANYIATYCHRPIMVFHSEKGERSAYYEAHHSPEHMVNFMAKKVQEVIFGLNQTILFKQANYSGATARYRSPDGQYEEWYEWHALMMNNQNK